MSVVTEERQQLIISHKDPWWKSWVSGYTTGMIYVFSGHPFDTVKTRIQTGTTKNIFRHLYRGILPPLMTTPLNWSVNFWLYHASLKLLKSDSLTSVYIAGGISGVLYGICMSPPELIKCYAQRYHLTTFQASKEIYHKLGSSMNNYLRLGLFRGMTAAIVRDTPATAAYFWALECSRRYIPGYNDSRVFLPFLSGVCAGVSCWTFALPGDCIKTIIQTEFASSVAVDKLPSSSFIFNFRKIMAENNGNFFRLYNSALPVFIRAIVTSGVGIIGLENFTRKMNDWIEKKTTFDDFDFV